MKSKKYKNPRTGHTIAVEQIILEYAIVERDWEGKMVSILAEDTYELNAQYKLNRLAELMDWEGADDERDAGGYDSIITKGLKVK